MGGYSESIVVDENYVLDIPANTAASRYRYAMDKLQAELRPLYRELL